MGKRVVQEEHTSGMSDTEDWVDVSDSANPAPVFKAADLCYVLRYPNSFGAEAKAVVKAHAHCNVCLSRAGVYCRDLGPEGPAFFHHLNARTTMSPCIEVDQL